MKQIFVQINYKKYGKERLTVYNDRNKTEYCDFENVPHEWCDAEAATVLLNFLSKNKFLSIVCLDDTTMEYFNKFS